VTNLEFSGAGNGRNLYAADRRIRLQAVVVDGNNLVYQWSVTTNGVQSSFDTPTLSLPPSPPAQYDITVRVWNKLSSLTVSTQLFTRERVVLSAVGNDGPKYPNKTTWIQSSFAQVGTDSCLLVSVQSIGDTLVGPVSCLILITSRYNRTLTGVHIPDPVLPTTSVPIVLTREANYEVTVRGFNEVSETRLESSVTCSTVDCSNPLLTLEGLGPSTADPRTRFRDKTIAVSSTAVLNCSASQKTSYFWTVEELVPISNSLADFSSTLIPLTFLTRNDLYNSTISFPQYTFKSRSLYKISLTVKMQEFDYISSTLSGYLYIVPNPIYPQFFWGATRAVDVESRFNVNAFNKSYDPDDATGEFKQYWKYKWYCYKQDDYVDFENPQLIAVPTSSNATDWTDRGGCFGTGAGRLDVPETNGLYLV
jgi:hypothetical protein